MAIRRAQGGQFRGITPLSGEGLATTARGRNGGRKHRLTEEQKVTARKLRADGHSIREIGQLLGNGKPVSRQTVYRALGMLSA